MLHYLAWLEQRRAPELNRAGYLCLASDGRTCWGNTYFEAVQSAMKHDKGASSAEVQNTSQASVLTPSDKAWLKKRRAKVHRFTEEWGDSATAWFQVVRGNKSLSGHPLPSAHEAVRSARKAKQ
jgi:hypothetical protein